MRRFAALFENLDTTTSTGAKVEAMAAYFRGADPDDAAWAAYILMGKRPQTAVRPGLLRRWLTEETALPEWLVEETYATVGDLAETIALLIEGAPSTGADLAADGDLRLSQWFELRLLPLQNMSESEQRRQVVGWWRQLAYRESFLVNKLLRGSLRVGVSRSLLTRALHAATGQPRIHIERFLMGEWTPGALFWQALLSGREHEHAAQPYPFYLASPLEGPPAALGRIDEWLAEWKWDGIRGQIVRRAGECALWSRGEELITGRFPEIVGAAMALPPGTVLDGEVVAWAENRVLPFAQLQRRIGRRNLTAKVLAEVPARFLSFDLLEFAAVDWRARPLRERRARLQTLLEGGSPLLAPPPALSAASWDALAEIRTESRARGVEGLVLKNRDSAYGTGRQRGAWWKWKIEPLHFDGVMIYAAPGSGRRSNLYTDYTFAVWDEDTLVPVAKAYSGLSDAEIRDLDKWIRTHTRERFGPVRAVDPVQVFEIAFEGIAASTRHKSGIAVRFPRIARWRTDKPARDADTLGDLRAILAGDEAAGG